MNEAGSLDAFKIKEKVESIYLKPRGGREREREIELYLKET
jgi:hypothetical protein